MFHSEEARFLKSSIIFVYFLLWHPQEKPWTSGWCEVMSIKRFSDVSVLEVKPLIFVFEYNAFDTIYYQWYKEDW